MDAVQLDGAEIAGGAARAGEWRGEAEFCGQDGADEVP
jgi:hypothetical protein